MPSAYPGALPVYAPHGVNMDDPPLHNDVHLQHEQDIVAIAGELGTNPSDVYTTVAARLAALASADTTEAAARAAADSTHTTNIAAKATVDSIMAGPIATVAFGNNALRVVVGTAVVTLSAFGTATVTLAQAMASANYIVLANNGDTTTANASTTCGVRQPDQTASTFAVHAQQAGGPAATGTFRVNYIAIGA